MTSFILRTAILLICLGLLPLPWILHDQQELTVDCLGLIASVSLLSLAIFKSVLLRRGEKFHVQETSIFQ